MLLHVGLSFVVLSLVDTAAIIACYALGDVLYEYAFTKRPIGVVFFIVQMALGTLIAGIHRHVHGRAPWRFVPLPARGGGGDRERETSTINTTGAAAAVTTHLLPISIQHAWQRWSTQIALYVHESTNNVLAATLVFGTFVAFYRRRLEGDGNDFPLGECLTIIMACLTLLILDVFHYYDREQTLQREMAFRKADDVARAFVKPTPHALVSKMTLSPPPSKDSAGTAAAVIVMTRADFYGSLTSYVLLCIVGFDMVAFHLPLWQSVTSVLVIVAIAVVGLLRRFLDDMPHLQS